MWKAGERELAKSDERWWAVRVHDPVGDKNPRHEPRGDWMIQPFKKTTDGVSFYHAYHTTAQQ